MKKKIIGGIIIAAVLFVEGVIITRVVDPIGYFLFIFLFIFLDGILLLIGDSILKFYKKRNKQNLFKKIGIYCLLFVIAFFCTIKIMPTKIILFDTYQGPPKEQMDRDDLMACIESKQCIHQGGFPFGYLVDLDGTSVLGSLGPEDHIIWYKFLGNVLFYFLIFVGLKTIGQKLLTTKK